jgi:hypothetical protein
MSTSRSIVIGGLLLCLVVGSLSAWAEEVPSDASPEANMFAGKIVWLMIDRSNAIEQSESSEVLKEPLIREMGGRFYIVGMAHTMAEGTDKDWRKGAEVGIDWNTVKQFYVFTPAQYEDAIKIWAEQNQEND